VGALPTCLEADSLSSVQDSAPFAGQQMAGPSGA
jgi:hypothetical protein